MLILALAASMMGPRPAHAMDFEEIALRTEHMPTSLRLEIFATCYMLTDDEIEDLLAYKSASHCEHWLDKWWRDRDPIHTTAENESRTEVYRRVEIARDRFRTSEVPGWDGRGEVLIRYGEPTYRHIIGRDVSNTEIVRAMEIWFYHSLKMAVCFEDAFGDGRYTYFTQHVRLPSGSLPGADRRSLPSENLPGTNMNAQTIDAAFQAMLNDGSLEGMPDFAEWRDWLSFHDAQWRFIENLATKPAAFPDDLPETHLPVDFSIDCFRGGDGVDRVDVNAAFLAAERDAETKYVATAVFTNSDGEEIQRNVHTTAVPPAAPGAPAPDLMSQLRFTVPPGFYHVAVTVEEFGTGRYGSFLVDKTCESFDGRLTVSDIMLATRIGPAESESVFNRGAFYVLPHPRIRYREEQPVPLYFEVYNLAPGRDGQGAYTVSYRLTAHSPRPQGFMGLFREATPLDVASRFTASCPGASDAVNITLQTANLWKGSYTIEVEITDDVSNRQTSRSADFEIGE